MFWPLSELAAKLPEHGNLIIWQEEPNRTNIKTKARITTFGLSSEADIRADNINYDNMGCDFDVIVEGQT